MIPKAPGLSIQGQNALSLLVLETPACMTRTVARKSHRGRYDTGFFIRLCFLQQTLLLGLPGAARAWLLCQAIELTTEKTA